MQDDARKGNPWERVADNCDFSLSGVSMGGHDKTRMKIAMVNRKQDLAKGGSML